LRPGIRAIGEIAATYPVLPEPAESRSTAVVAAISATNALMEGRWWRIAIDKDPLVANNMRSDDGGKGEAGGWGGRDLRARGV
jgi:hypothetical protein